MENQEKEILSIEQKEIIANSTLIIPDNDGEARMVIDIARKTGMDVRVIDQAWGANIEKDIDDPAFLRGFRKNVLVFEMPNSEAEEKLQAQGFSVAVIDHHEYKNNDRSNEKSSIEQFLERLNLTEEQLAAVGLDPRFVRGVGINDKSYIYGLRDAGYSEDEIKALRDFDVRAQMRDRYDEMVAKNEEIYNKRTVQNGVTIVSALDTDICTIAGDRIAFDQPESIPKILDVRHDSEGKVSLLFFLGPTEATQEMNGIVPASFMGSTKVSKKSNFMGWVKPTAEQLGKIQERLGVEEIQ